MTSSKAAPISRAEGAAGSPATDDLLMKPKPYEAVLDLDASKELREQIAAIIDPEAMMSPEDRIARLLRGAEEASARPLTHDEKQRIANMGRRGYASLAHQRGKAQVKADAILSLPAFQQHRRVVEALEAELAKRDDCIRQLEDEAEWVWAFEPMVMADASRCAIQQWNNDGPGDERLAEEVDALRLNLAHIRREVRRLRALALTSLCEGEEGLTVSQDPSHTHNAASVAPQPDWSAAWRCGTCACGTYARVDEPQPGGGFAPGSMVRCVNCKAVTAREADASTLVSEAACRALNTSGAVRRPRFARPLCWSDLDSFEQGYIRALFADIEWPDPNEGHGPSCAPRFEWLAPETLSEALKDSEAFRAYRDEQWSGARAHSATDGRDFWGSRQGGAWTTWKPLVAYLGQDGRIYTRPDQSAALLPAPPSEAG